MNIVLLGGPGAGKGTQSDFLIKEFGMMHISTGDLLRDAVERQTEAGIKVESYMKSGNLVPDEIIIEIMKEKFSQIDLSKGLILDGFPRTVVQAQKLDTMLSEINSKIDKAILIDTPNEVIINRICSRRTCKNCGFIGSVANLDDEEVKNYRCPKCGDKMIQREDDNKSVILNRIDVYEKQTAPVVDYYKNKNKLFSVDGSLPAPSNVFENIKTLIK